MDGMVGDRWIGVPLHRGTTACQRQSRGRAYPRGALAMHRCGAFQPVERALRCAGGVRISPPQPPLREECVGAKEQVLVPGWWFPIAAAAMSPVEIENAGTGQRTIRRNVI